VRFGYAQLVTEFHRRSLQPIDADRFLVTHLVLEADVHIVAGFHHLLGGLGKARLVAIDRRNREETGHEKHDRTQRQEDDGAEMA
jgi:hypothetical protein